MSQSASVACNWEQELLPGVRYWKLHNLKCKFSWIEGRDEGIGVNIMDLTITAFKLMILFYSGKWKVSASSCFMAHRPSTSWDCSNRGNNQNINVCWLFLPLSAKYWKRGWMQSKLVGRQSKDGRKYRFASSTLSILKSNWVRVL